MTDSFFSSTAALERVPDISSGLTRFSSRREDSPFEGSVAPEVQYACSAMDKSDKEAFTKPRREDYGEI